MQTTETRIGTLNFENGFPSEANWIETVPGKGFYPMMRFYSPKAGLFDGTWTLGCRVGAMTHD